MCRLKDTRALLPRSTGQEEEEILVIPDLIDIITNFSVFLQRKRSQLQVKISVLTILTEFYMDVPPREQRLVQIKSHLLSVIPDLRMFHQFWNIITCRAAKLSGSFRGSEAGMPQKAKIQGKKITFVNVFSYISSCFAVRPG